MGESHSKVQKQKAPAANPADKEETKVNTEAQHKSPTKNKGIFIIRLSITSKMNFKFPLPISSRQKLLNSKMNTF